MLPIFLILLLVVPTLFSVPSFPYIISALTIAYLITRIRKGRNLRSIRKLTEKKGEKNELEIKKENETLFIESTTDIILYVLISFVVASLILHFSIGLSTSVSKALLLPMILCLLTAIYMYTISPFHEDERKQETHYKNFCKSYMDERYQEFLRDEKKQKSQEYIKEEHERRWIAKHGEQPPYEEKRFEDRRKGLGEVWGDRRKEGRTEDRRQPDGEIRVYLS